LHKALKPPCAIMTGSIIILAPQPEFLGSGSAVNGAVSNRRAAAPTTVKTVVLCTVMRNLPTS
jgi:hypothetical protein